jgi:hypothetical protein
MCNLIQEEPYVNLDSIDWLGMDSYPYFEDTVPNSVDNAYSLFWEQLGPRCA